MNLHLLILMALTLESLGQHSVQQEGQVAWPLPELGTQEVQQRGKEAAPSMWRPSVLGQKLLALQSLAQLEVQQQLSHASSEQLES